MSFDVRSATYAQGIYVASRVIRAPTWRMYRERGIPINSTWIDEAGEGETADFGELWERVRSEIDRSRALVLYVSGVQDFPLKGALVEVGMALAMGKKVFVFLDNVMLDGRTMRPAGSWVLDRNVALCDSLDEAIDRAMHETFSQSEIASIDPGTEKLLRDLLDRAYKMMLMSGYRLQEHDPDHNDPITAWMSDARSVLYGSTKPEPDLGRLA